MIPGSGIKIVLDRERTLRFDMNAQVAFEDTTGENTLDSAFWMKPMTAKTTRALVWACLVHDDPALTVTQVGALLTSRNAKSVKAALDQALIASIPEGDGDTEGDGGKK